MRKYRSSVICSHLLFFLMQKCINLTLETPLWNLAGWKCWQNYMNLSSASKYYVALIPDQHSYSKTLWHAVLDLFVLKSLCDFQQTSVHECSVLSTEGEREKRFPKPELEIRFTPLKPDRLKVIRPGDDESVTVKIKRTARKRKSAEIEVCVDAHRIRKMFSLYVFFRVVITCL